MKKIVILMLFCTLFLSCEKISKSIDETLKPNDTIVNKKSENATSLPLQSEKKEINLLTNIEILKKAEEHLKEGHKGHFDLVQKEARGEKLEFSILFMHAEDQLLTTATLKDVVTEMINMYTMIHEK